MVDGGAAVVDGVGVVGTAATTAVVDDGSDVERLEPHPATTAEAVKRTARMRRCGLLLLVMPTASAAALNR